MLHCSSNECINLKLSQVDVMTVGQCKAQTTGSLKTATFKFEISCSLLLERQTAPHSVTSSLDYTKQAQVFVSVRQVQQLFGLGPGPLPAATPRELLAALLGGLRDVHWAKAVGCQPEPGLLTPISVETAMSGEVPTLKGFQIQRAVAAAERTHFLHPSDRLAHVRAAFALLLS